ncbi:hypothetical protein POF51_22170 [Brevibacillus sp. AG]|uniref:hypothetical protein n=1 Tax=Brevibacillus sp. AG TaxID=3020891 RepID=UPI00232E0210|nr:hypothetical protein [Brevibacillus sp. AG]MDC0763434.1 hypothetical protein [Brevibacillus sp. AG]
MEISTYPEMNDRIKDILTQSGLPVDAYAAKRIEELETESKRLREALEKVDVHIRSTSDPVPHIIQTLKNTLPEYKCWWNIGE